MNQYKRLKGSIRTGLAAASLFATATLVFGCALELPGSGDPSQLYVLTPKSTFPDDLISVDWQLLVEKTTSSAGLDTPRIAVAYSAIELDYFARSNWTDRAPQMVQRLIVESFENSERIVGVGGDAIGLRSDFLLKTELREFQAEIRKKKDGSQDGLPRIRVRLNAKLVKMPQRIIVASKTFEKVVPAEEKSMKGIIIAFDEALGRTIKSVVIWTLTEGEAVRNKPRD